MTQGEIIKFIDTYKSIKADESLGIRGIIRNVVLNGLSLRDQITGIEEHLKKPRIQFLYIHHIFKDELENFEKLLMLLSKDHSFIPYKEAVNKVLTNDIDKPYIAISSDDGFKNNLLAIDILKKYNAQACFFINTDLIGETDFIKIKNHCWQKLNFPPVEFLSWEDVEKLQKEGHEIGSHTTSHLDIAKASRDEIVNDMHETMAILTRKCGPTLHFAFPYGRFFNFSEEGRRAVFDAGFISCASAERGCHVPGTIHLAPEKLCIRRDHIILDWDINHILYFLNRNSKKAGFHNNIFPY